MKSLLFGAMLSGALLAACGGGGSDPMPTGPLPSNPSGTIVQVNLGDAPADRLLAVDIVVSAMTFTHADGTAVSILTTPRHLEMMQLMGTVTPVALSNMPQGHYTGATMTFGDAKVTYVDATSAQLVQRSVPGPMSATMVFNPPLNVGSTPAVINVDMNMAASVAIDAIGGVTMTPTMTARMNPMAAGSRHAEDGGMHGLTGSVTGVQGSAFTLSMSQGLIGAPMATHSGTHYSGVGGMGMMAESMLISVDATPQSDGTWRVDHVASQMGAGGSMAAGLVTGVSGAPPTQLTLVMHDGAGNGMLGSDLGGTAVISLGAGTAFSVDADDVDLSGLTFTPQFDRAHLSKGQAIRAWSSTQMGHDGHDHGMMGVAGGSTVTATLVQLQAQGLRGTVSGYTSDGVQASFTLTMPVDSAFARLSGNTAVTVYQRSNTRLRDLTSPANGGVVQVRGLLFADGGAFRLVANRIVGN